MAPDPNKSVVEIIKQHDEYKYSIEVTTINSKFEKQVSVKVRTDGDLLTAVEEAKKAHAEAVKP